MDGSCHDPFWESVLLKERLETTTERQVTESMGKEQILEYVHRTYANNCP